MSSTAGRKLFCSGVLLPPGTIFSEAGTNPGPQECRDSVGGLRRKIINRVTTVFLIILKLLNLVAMQSGGNNFEVRISLFLQGYERGVTGGDENNRSRCHASVDQDSLVTYLLLTLEMECEAYKCDCTY